MPRFDAPIRVLIVDDSIVVRTMMRRMLEEHDDFAVCGIACGAEQALALLADTAVDVILLDVEMPGMDGLTALPAIQAAGRGAHVVIVSSACDEGAGAGMRALALGASDTIAKPPAGELNAGFSAGLAERLRRLRPARRAARAGAAPPIAVAVVPPAPARRDPIGCIAVGASTGGLVALSALFEGLDARCDAPILVTQHLPAEFMPYFADQLGEIAGRPTTVAVAGQPLVAGQIVVAAGTAHLALVRDGDRVRIRHDGAAPASAYLPSVDPMFAAVADVFGARGVGVMLSGMGRDGVAGAARLAAAGGEILAQDAASATIWGMPGAVVRGGLADAVLPPAAIGRRIVARAVAAAADAAGPNGAGA